MSAVAVAGRRRLCVNRDALETAGASASRLNERCLELAEEGRKAGRKAGGGAKKETTSDGRGGRGVSKDESKKEKEKRVSFPSQAPRRGRRARGGGFGDPDGHRGFGERGREAPGVSVLRGARARTRALISSSRRLASLFCTRRRATRWAYD